jgi:hypothetical protein
MTDDIKSLVLRNDFLASAKKKSARRRQPGRTFSIRLTDAERQHLNVAAGRLPLGTYIRRTLFGDSSAIAPARRAPKKLNRPNLNQAQLAQVLVLLGRRDVYNSLRSIAQAAQMGALPVTPELLTEIHHACADLRVIRATLMSALKVSAGFSDDPRG